MDSKPEKTSFSKIVSKTTEIISEGLKNAFIEKNQ